MTMVPTRAERLQHAKDYIVAWNAGDREGFKKSWSNVAKGAIYMHDPVGTELKHSDNAVEYLAHTFDIFAKQLKMTMIIVKVNGNEIAWVIENRYADNPMTHSIEVLSWDDDGTLHVKTYYDMPEDIGSDKDPYQHILEKNNDVQQLAELQAFKKN
jgi:hypothetical protein